MSAFEFNEPGNSLIFATLTDYGIAEIRNVEDGKVKCRLVEPMFDPREGIVFGSGEDFTIIVDSPVMHEFCERRVDILSQLPVWQRCMSGYTGSACPAQSRNRGRTLSPGLHGCQALVLLRKGHEARSLRVVENSS